MRETVKLMSKEEIAEQYKAKDWKNKKGRQAIRDLQLVVYVMAGGGFLGRSAAEQPKGFYIDSRIPKRPYPAKAVYQAVRVLERLAEINGMDPNHLPEMSNFPGCGVF